MATAERMQLFKIHKSTLDFIEKENYEGFWAYRREIENLLKGERYADTSIASAFMTLVGAPYNFIEHVPTKSNLRKGDSRYTLGGLKFRLASGDYDGYADAFKVTEKYKADKSRIYFS